MRRRGVARPHCNTCRDGFLHCWEIHQLERASREIREAAETGNPDALRRLREIASAKEDKLAAIMDEEQFLADSHMDDTAILAALNDFDPLWQHMSSRERARLVELLVERVPAS
jgi:hypothetical protein